MKLEVIIELTKDKIKIPEFNLDDAVIVISTHLITFPIVHFCDLHPLLDMGKYKKRITEADAVSVIRMLLSDGITLEISDGLLQDVLERIKYSPKLQVDLDKGIKDGELFVNCLNGEYDIMKRHLRSSPSGIEYNYITGINYKPGSSLNNAPNFKKFVETSVGMENYDCLMRSLGYCISSLTKGRKAFELIGKGKTGKSTLLNLLQSIFDPDLVSHQPFHIMGSEKSRWHYAGKRINISRENNSTPMKDDEGFKSLVSSEETVGREVYQKYIHYTPTLKFIFASNWPLCFAHPDDAVIDRLVVIRFTREIPAKDIDHDLEEKLKSEKDIIFSLAIDTLKDLIESGYDFKMSEDSEEYLRQQRAQIHTVQDFLAEKTVIAEDGSISSDELFKNYNHYCDINAITPVGRNTFKEKVMDYDSKIKCGKVYDSVGRRVNGYKGIKFNLSKNLEEKDDKDN